MMTSSDKIKNEERPSGPKSLKPLPIRILLLEDNPDDADILQADLDEPPEIPFDVHWVERLETALVQLGTQKFDVALVDLNLPDSQGIETLVRIRDFAPTVPVIVLTGLDDEKTAIKAVQLGSQDYLIKGRTRSDLLIRAIRYAIERNHLQIQLELIRTREYEDTEIRLLNHLTQPSPATITAHLQSAVTLQEAQADVFDEMVDFYMELMDLAMEHLIHREHPDISDQLIELAERLGFFRSGPRDVVDIHKAALKKQKKALSPKKMEVCIREGRMMIVEVMGHLVSYYRNYAVLASSIPSRTNTKEPS